MNSAPLSNLPSSELGELAVPGSHTSWLLKAALLLDGLAADRFAESWLLQHGHCVGGFPHGYRVEIELGTGSVFAPLVSLNAPPTSAPQLNFTASQEAAVVWGGKEFPISLSPAPACYEAHTSSGRVIGEFTTLLGNVLVLGGPQACGYSISGNACRFCRVGSRSDTERTFGVSPQEAAEAVRAAQKERRIRWVLLTAASFDAEDGGVREIEPIVRAVRRHSSALVLASLHPPRNMRWIDHAYAIGVDGVSFNLEFHDVAVLQRLLPGRARYVGRSRYIQALRHAAKIFPRGAVWTEVIAGAASEAEDRHWLQQLLEWNVVPYLVPFGTNQTVRPLSAPIAVSLDGLQRLLSFVHETESGLARTFCWLPAWPHLLGTADIRQAAPAQRTGFARCYPVAGRVGELLLRNFSRIRRTLRVRDAEEHEVEQVV